MKNIHNLLTDAFDAAQMKEQDYNITITNNYEITIRRRDTGRGILYIFMEMEQDTLRAVDFVDTILTNEQQAPFFNVIRAQVIPYPELIEDILYILSNQIVSNRPPNPGNPGNLRIDTSLISSNMLDYRSV